MKFLNSLMTKSNNVLLPQSEELVLDAYKNELLFLVRIQNVRKIIICIVLKVLGSSINVSSTSTKEDMIFTVISILTKGMRLMLPLSSLRKSVVSVKAISTMRRSNKWWEISLDLMKLFKENNIMSTHIVLYGLLKCSNLEIRSWVLEKN